MYRLSRGVLRVSGADAAPFLQAQLTSDVLALAPGGSQPAAVLTPRGRVAFVGRVCAEAHDSFLLETGAWAAPQLRKLLRLYKLRAKVAVDDISADVQAWGAREAGALALPAAPLAQYEDPLGARAILPAAVPEPAGAPLLDAGPLQLLATLEGLAPGVAMIDGIPLECNLDLLGALSVTKGCYLGQELVARTFFKGVVRKRLLPFVCSPTTAAAAFGEVGPAEALAAASDEVAALAAGDELRCANGKRAGRVVHVHPGSNAGVALVRLQHARAGEVRHAAAGALQIVQPTWWPEDFDWETGKRPL